MRSPNATEKKEKKQKNAKATNETYNEVKDLMNEINKSYAVVQRGSQMLIMRQGFDSKGDRHVSYISPRDFSFKLAHMRVFDPVEEKYISVANQWVNWEGRKEYEGIFFSPNAEVRPGYFNLWQGFAHSPSQNGSCEKFIEHIRCNICNNNEEAYIWLMSWLADIFQNPAHKPGTALVLRGEMGIGKGKFANHIGKLLGAHYIAVANPSQVTGRFNSHLAEKVLMFIDESFWSGEKVGAGVLRALITEPAMASEMKGRDVVNVDSFLRIIIAANDEWAVPVGMKDERRFVVLDVSNDKQRNYEFFAAIDEEMENGGYGALMQVLLDWKYKPNAPREIIKTHALFEQKLHSMPNEAKWWMDCLKREYVAMQEAAIEGIVRLEKPHWNEHYRVTTEQLYNNYSQWHDNQRMKNKMTLIGIGRFLNKFVPSMTKARGIYNFGTLEQCKSDFSNAIGHEIEWETM